jgi:excisionase family DNA binding protein
MTVEAAADYLQIAPSTLRHWISAKRIEYVKIGKLTRFRRTALDRWIERQIIAEAK